MDNTKYRILPLETFIGDMYLQFKLNNTWRFVPRELDAYVLGVCLTQKSCPKSLPSHQEDGFLHSFHKQENYNLIPFTKRYENIEDYFKHLRKKHKEHLKEKKENKETAQTIYL